MQVTIYIASNDKKMLQDLKNILYMKGYEVIGTGNDASKVLRDVRTLKMDIILLDSNLPGINGIEVAEIISSFLTIPIIIISESWREEIKNVTRRRLVQTTIIKPVTYANLLPAIETALANYEEVIKLKQEVDSLKEKLETRKVVEKAKGILMEKFKLSEEEAYKLIRKQSMNQSKTMKEVAEAIITSSKIFGIDSQ